MTRRFATEARFAVFHAEALAAWRRWHARGRITRCGENLTVAEKAGLLRAFDAGWAGVDHRARLVVDGFAGRKVWELYCQKAGGVFWSWRESLTQVALAAELVERHRWDPADVALERGALDVAGTLEGRVALACETKVNDAEMTDYLAVYRELGGGRRALGGNAFTPVGRRAPLRHPDRLRCPGLRRRHPDDPTGVRPAGTIAVGAGRARAVDQPCGVAVGLRGKVPPAVCYLDIETDRNRDIALVGVLTRTHVHHVAYPEAALAGWLDEVLPARGRLYTFNGTAFDLPALRRHTGQDVTGRLAHVDLRAACAAVGLRGGQKAIEAATGFRRDHALLSWGQIFGLCDRYALTGCEWSFGRLVGYNADDLYGMRWIRAHLGC